MNVNHLSRLMQLGNLAQDACLVAQKYDEARELACYLNGLEDAAEALGIVEDVNHFHYGNAQELVGQDPLEFRGYTFTAEGKLLVWKEKTL